MTHPIVTDALARIGLPSALPQSCRRGRAVEIGLAYRMADGPPYSGRGRLVADAWTGMRGTIVDACSDGDVELEMPGGGVFIHHARIRTIRPDGTAQPSTDEREVTP